MKESRDTTREDAAIDAGLRRLFAPPERVVVPEAIQARASRTAHGSVASERGAPWPRQAAAFLACAAGLGGLWLAVRAALPAPLATTAPVERIALGTTGPQAVPGSGEPAVALPLGPGAGEASAGAAPGAAARASLPSGWNPERLYAEATRAGEAMATCSGPELDLVRSALGERCGQLLRLHPEAAGLLQGPFGSAELPQGTLLTGYPEGPLGEPSVLVAECDGSLACCLDGLVADSGALRAFHARVGDLVLTEITPRAEPRLLQLFESP